MQGLSDQEAAARIGVDRTTIFRWRNLPGFARELENQRRLRRERAANQLQSMVPSALKILQEQLDSKDNRERLRAVSILLRFATPSRLAGAAQPSTGDPAAADIDDADEDADVADALDAYINAPLPDGSRVGEVHLDDGEDDGDEDDNDELAKDEDLDADT